MPSSSPPFFLFSLKHTRGFSSDIDKAGLVEGLVGANPFTVTVAKMASVMIRLIMVEINDRRIAFRS